MVSWQQACKASIERKRRRDSVVVGRGNGGSDTNFLRPLLMDRDIRWITSTSGNTSASYCSLFAPDLDSGCDGLLPATPRADDGQPLHGSRSVCTGSMSPMKPRACTFSLLESTPLPRAVWWTEGTWWWRDSVRMDDANDMTLCLDYGELPFGWPTYFQWEPRSPCRARIHQWNGAAAC